MQTSTYKYDRLGREWRLREPQRRGTVDGEACRVIRRLEVPEASVLH